MTVTGDATYQIENNVCTMRFERQIAQPVERVWAAFTEPEDLNAWFYPFQGTLAAGETVLIPWEEDGGLTSKIVAFDPPRVFAWTWHKPGEPESIVRWELFPESTGTRFVLTHSLPVLAANETQLGQVFQNLIGNALKFRGSEDPRVEISATRDGNAWIFAVSDNGIGVDPQYHDRIFELFRRSGTQDKPGEGIGLAHVRSLMRNLGGDIVVRSELGQGTTFVLRLPPDLSKVVRSMQA